MRLEGIEYQRLRTMLGHIDPTGSQQRKQRKQRKHAPEVEVESNVLTAVNNTAGMGMTGLQGLLPLVAIGGYMLWQRRKKGDETKVDNTPMQDLMETMGFDKERMDALATWAEALVKTKKVPGMVLMVAREGKVRPAPRCPRSTTVILFGAS